MYAVSMLGDNLVIMVEMIENPQLATHNLDGSQERLAIAINGVGWMVALPC